MLLVHMVVRDDHENRKRTYVSLFKTEEEAVNAMVASVTNEGFDSDLEERIRKEHRCFIWEWERRCNYDAWYIVGEKESVTINLDKHFKDWD